MTKDEKIALYEDMLGITEDNDRYTRLRDRYGMSPGATWLLSRLVAAKGRWIPVGVLLDAMPGVDDAHDRQASNVKVRIAEVRKAILKESVDHDRVLGYRLSPLGVHVMREFIPQRRSPVPAVVISTARNEHGVLLDEQTVQRLLNDPDMRPLDAIQLHGVWRAQGG